MRASDRIGFSALGVIVAILAGCTGEGRQSEAVGAGSTVTEESGATAGRRGAGDSLPAAVLGTAPPPRGEPAHYFAADPATRGYIVAPAGEGPFPAVILIHEWDGLNDRVRQIADALADEGYIALAADLYSGQTGGSPEENMALVREARADIPGVIANLDTAAAFLRAREDVTGKIAAMGWCFGGGIALSYALGGEHHDGTAIFYGSLVTDPVELAKLDHPIYGTFAEMDSSIPPDEVTRFVAALHGAGIPNDVHVYDAVDHGFWLRVDENPATRRAPALDAWIRLKAYLSRTLRDA